MSCVSLKIGENLIESNDLREVRWVKVANKYERLPQDQWGFVFQGSRGFADEVCLEVEGTDIVAQVAL